MGARDALQHVRQRDHRQADQAEHEGHDIVALDHGRRAARRRACRWRRSSVEATQHEDAAGDENAAQFRHQVLLAEFRDEADDRGVEAEAGEVAGDHHGDPDQHEDAVFEAAHPARQQDLADEGDGRAEDADREGDERHAARLAALVAVVSAVRPTWSSRGLAHCAIALRQQPLGRRCRGKAHAIVSEFRPAGIL